MNFTAPFHSHSPAAQRLAEVLLHSLWQCALVALLAAEALRALKHHRPEARHAVCATGLGLALLAPCLTWRMLDSSFAAPLAVTAPAAFLSTPAETRVFHSPAEEPRKMYPSSPSLRNFEASSPPVSLTRLVEKDADWRPLVSAFWLAGVVTLGLWRLAGLGRLYRWRREARPASDEFSGRVRLWAARMGLRRAPRLRITHRLMSPAVAGVWRPVILLPAAVVSGLSLRELDAILTHELEHLRRHDFVINLLQCAAEALLFYHPAMWWLSRRMRLERELCCDEAAARLTGDRATLAKALARVAELGFTGTGFLSAPAAAGHPLKLRIRRLLEPPPVRILLKTSILPHPVLAALAVLLVVFPKDPAPAQAPERPLRAAIIDRNGVVLAHSEAADLTHNDKPLPERRSYPWKALAGHALGYTGVRKEDGPPLTGVYGVEKTMSAILEENAAPGSPPTVRLTLDARLQHLTQTTLREAGVQRGAVVLMDPDNGDILAMASAPDLDVSLFTPKITVEAWKALNEDPAFPLMNRALSESQPGSVFKIVTALAAAKRGVWNRSYNCSGAVNYGRVFNCWTAQKGLAPHGTIGLSEALKRSCNCWFYQCGNAAGIDAIAEAARWFGVGDSGKPLPFEVRSIGFMPDRQWWERKNMGPWTAAKTANVSIGQGEVFVTPVQMTLLAAALANGGTVWQPRLVSHMKRDGQWREQPPVRWHDLKAEGVPPEAIAAIRGGLWKTVNEQGGTAAGARFTPGVVAGKTGTTQAWRQEALTKRREKDNHTWFTGFAPFDKPRFAISVLVANGESGGQVSAPVARRILKRALEIEAGKPYELTPVEPTPGGFRLIDRVEFKDAD